MSVASMKAADSVDQLRAPLSISVEAPASSSSFPSPASALVPPPVVNMHEAKGGDSAKVSQAKPKTEGSTPATGGVARKDHTPALTESSLLEPPADDPNASYTPTPTTKDKFQQPTVGIDKTKPSIYGNGEAEPPHPNTSSPPLSSKDHKDGDASAPTASNPPSVDSINTNRSSMPHIRHSLSSNRPAPPSPALSRRASASRSTFSSSRPPSMGFTNPSVSRLSTSYLSPQSITNKPQKKQPIRVFDFAYPTADERHHGLGPDVPKQNRVKVINRRAGYRDSTSSNLSTTSSDGYGDDGDDDEEGRYQDVSGEDDGWNGFKLGLGRLSMWSGPPRQSALADGSFPSITDLARNFEDNDDEEDAEGDGYYDDEEPAEELVPGTYRALYAFEPEGAAEMALEEDQVVRIIGRGGGIGWAVAVKADGSHALVPESYLELIEQDDENSTRS